MTEIRSIRRAILNREIAALKAECLAFDELLREARLDLWLRYDPNQPRVPAGSSEGGRWTDGDAAGRVGGPGSGGAGGEAGSGGAASGGVGSASEWRTIAQGVTDEGARTETVVRTDGTTIHSEYAAPGAAGIDERHTVTTPDGSQRTFENERLLQTVRDELGEVMSRSEFRPDGAVGMPVLEPAAAQALPTLLRGAQATFATGIALYSWATTQNNAQQQAVLTFSARDFTNSRDLTRIDMLSRSELAAVCPAYPTVQSLTDQAAWSTDRTGLTPQQYGTAVHTRLKALADSVPGLRGEVSLMKSIEAHYGQSGSVRIDIVEDRGDGTLCVYDIKTGERGLSLPRSVEISNYAFSQRRTFSRPITRIIVTEVRPFE